MKTDNQNYFNLIKIDKRKIYTDGDGIYDLIALSGCPLKCKYCINKKILSCVPPHKVTPEDILSDVLSELCYFIATNGGITFGGGEPLLQYKSITELCQIKPKWINANIETSLNYSQESVIELIPYINEWIIDIKSLNNKIYQKYTGTTSERMKQNLKFLSETIPQKCTIRIPIIPNYKDEEIAKQEVQKIKEMGFTKTDMFYYIIKEEGTKACLKT